MTSGDNVDGKFSEQMEGEEILRKVECLRGRLLAERAASRNAKEESALMETKLIELESRLKEETRSRNRAEKKLKFLMKKLESLEIFYVTDESEQSSFMDKSEISCASSVASTSVKEAQDKEVNANAHCTVQNIQESVENPPVSSFIQARDFEHNVSQISASSSQSYNSPAEEQEEENNSIAESAAQKFETGELRENLFYPHIYHNSSVEEAYTAKSCDPESSQNDDRLTIHNDSFNCSIQVEILAEGEDEEQDYCVDNSMALVPVNFPKKQIIDPVVLDATVKEVLDTLRHAKEKLQTSMERRRVIKVG